MLISAETVQVQNNLSPEAYDEQSFFSNTSCILLLHSRDALTFYW